MESLCRLSSRRRSVAIFKRRESIAIFEKIRAFSAYYLAAAGLKTFFVSL
jgi:hypothetical protein